MSQKVMMSIKISQPVAKQLLTQVIADQYGMRGKSRWIEEAVQAFLKLPNFVELVNIASEQQHFDQVISMRFSELSIAALERALIEVRRHYPEMEGVKSHIIRASIMQRFIRQVSQ